MKRFACMLFAALVALSAAAGCAQTEARSLPFTADNEIFTYTRIDPEKTQITVSRTGNIEVQTFCMAFEEANPDVQVLYLDITGGNEGCKPAVDWIKHGYAPDVMISAANFFDADGTTDYFVNFSANPIIERYETAALQRTATNANVFWLPGPSDIIAMLYNKTLFAQYGWEVPATFDEFIALCLQIRADTNGEVEPWNPNAKYSNELLTVLEAFCYEEVFAGADNRTWYNGFVNGKTGLDGHLDPYYRVLQTLKDNDLLREEHFSYSATARGKEFAAGKIAMINGAIKEMDGGEYEFGYMPFPATVGTLGYINDTYNSFVGIPKKEHTEAEQDAIDRFIAFFSTPEGQRAYIGEALMVSNVKDVPLSHSDDLAALRPAVDAGHLFARLDFHGTSGSIGFSLYEDARSIALGEKTGAECASAAENAAYIPEAVSAQEPPEAVARAPLDMTILETSFYMADMYREAAGADIGLIANNAAYRGNLMRIFAGDITPAMVTVLKPRSFANDTALIKVSMTGRQLLDALNHPVGDGHTAECVYAYSGLACEIAPWSAQGERMRSVKLASGAPLDENALYTVAFWDGTVEEAYITERLETVEGSWEALMTAKMKADGSVTPASDKRVKLLWS